MAIPEKLYIVVPCCNEEAMLPETARRLSEKLRGLIAKGLAARDSRILLVDDGSRDRTWGLILRYHREEPLITGIKLASVWTAAGLQLVGLGLVGGYLGKVYMEVKDRPRYLIETDLGEDS